MSSLIGKSTHIRGNKGLPLRYQVFGVLIISQLLLIALISSIINWRIGVSFSRLESEYVERHVRQIISGITNEVDSLRATTVNWASWDLMYAYVQGEAPDFIERELPLEISQTLLLNVIIILDISGKVLFSRGTNLDNRVEEPLPEGIHAYIQPGNLLTDHQEVKSEKYGIIALSNRTLLVSSRPVTTSHFKGPIMGTIIMGRYLDSREIAHIAATTNISFNLLRTDIRNHSSLMPYIDALSPEAPLTAIAKDDDQIYGFGLLNDLSGKKCLVVGTELPRAAFYEGRKMFLQFVLSFLVITLVATLGFLFFFDRRVLWRIMRLGKEVAGIGQRGDFSARVRISGNDEITRLAESFNHMMGQLEQAQRQVRAKEARLEAIFESAADGIILIDTEGKILGFNRSAEGIFGYSSEEIIGQNVRLLMPEPHDVHHTEYIKHYMETAQPQILGSNREVLGKRKDNSVFPMMLAVSEVKEHGTSIFTGIVRDITEHKRAEELLRHAATHDGLTQLLNRKRFEERLGVALHACIRYGHSLTLIMCDLDHFKEINDQYGHAMGDEVLRRFSRIIREEIRTDDFGGRFGGDEFCMCLNHTPSMHAMTCIERIRNRIVEEHFESESGQSFQVSASFGMAEYRTTQTDVPSLFAAADRALYTAKKHGRNRICIDNL